MLVQFFIGEGADKRQHAIDTSKFETLNQLKSSLANNFSFADRESLRFHGGGNGALSTLEDVKSCQEPIELRVTDRDPIRIPPGPRSLPVVGNHYEIYPDALGNYDRLFARYGPMIKTVNMGTTIYHTNDPEIARYVLREGDLFTKRTSDPSHPLHYMSVQDALFTCDSDSPAFAISHKFIPPALSPRAMAHYTPHMQETARSCFPVLDQLDEKDLGFNVYHFTFKLASQIIWRMIVGGDLEHFKAIDTPPALPIRLFGQYLRLMKRNSLRPKWYGKLPFGEGAQLRTVEKNLFTEVQKAIDACTDPGACALPLSDPKASLQASCVADFLRRARDENGEGLPPDILLANTVVAVGAGFTTSASMLAWVIYALTAYPGNQERLLQEIIDHGADGKRAWTYEEVHSMQFLDCFVKETQRVHSPSFQTARNARQDVVLPRGYLIPKDSVVIACFPSMHMNTAHWDNPHRFDPDRWIGGGLAREQAKKGVYTPFAAGRRGCVGFNLALLEVKMVLIELIYRYHFEDSSPEAVIYDPEFLVTRPVNFYASATRRTSWPSPSGN
ncbi:cytochrome P450 [Hypomontagnella monticulosa]|nr:cytochrome P450 [Hypomontagnella monticulosa]